MKRLIILFSILVMTASSPIQAGIIQDVKDAVECVLEITIGYIGLKYAVSQGWITLPFELPFVQQ